MRSPRRSLTVTAFAFLAGALFAASAEAQYFGRNAVQWRRLRFETLKTEHFDIYYYPEEGQAAEQVGRLAERWYARESRLFGFQLPAPQPIILYASHTDFEQTKVLGGPPGEGTGGVTEAFKRRIVLPAGASLAETDHVLGHEMVHAFQYAMTGQGRISATNYPSALKMPLWFIEGMAEYVSVGPVDPHTAMWIRDAARKETLPRIKDLGSSKYFPYRYGQALWAYIAGRFGDHVFGDALRAIGPRSNDAEEVLHVVLGIDEEQLSRDWHASIRNALAPVAVGKHAPADYGPALVTEKSQGGRLNVGPALSPDGSQIAFLSERELFSVELFVADARTGSVERRLSQTTVDPHLESLEFISSAGSWDDTGRRLAIGAVGEGRPLLVILDPHSGEQLERIPLVGVDEILTPSFSPDGRKVVFSALVGGFTDLFSYDLDARALRRLTDDPMADLQPAWSPDGRTIAFVTDRFTTRPGDLESGDYRLATYEVASGEVRALPSFADAKNIDPQWAASGRSLFFVSDATGISNVYRLDLDGGELRQVTDLLTGVSGITALSPALSVARATSSLAYSVYDDDRYEIYTIDDPERLTGWPARTEGLHRARLIPGAQEAGEVLTLTADASTGLPRAETFAHAPYQPHLGLDYIGQPYVSAGVDRYGTAFGGGVSMSFSDMLGEHSLDVVAQANSIQGFTDLGALASYVNRVHRLNWGVQAGQVPYVAGSFGSGVDVSTGRPLYVEQTLQQRQLDRSVAGLAYYPFDSSTRLELQAGYRSISFQNRLTTDSYDYATGQFVGTEKTDLPGGSALDLVEASAALVGDTSLFGPTSPILGQRFRFSVSPVTGSIDYVGVLADYRKYVMPVRPLTVAGRILHYGRYGSGGEDPRLVPLFVGYQSLVRGYDNSSFSVSECVGDTGGCPVYDQLIGSRLLVFNLEARVPLLALFGARDLYGPIPVEIGAFFDSGVAWDAGSRPRLLGGERSMARSVGGTARINLLGFAVLQIDYAKPLDRPGKKPFFQFNFLAGF